MAIKVADAFIAVGGDLTGYRKSLGDAKTEAMSLGQQIKAALTNPAGFGGSSKVAGFIADLKLGRNLTASLKDAANGLGGTLKGLSVKSLHSGLNGIKSVLGGLRGLANDIFKGFSIGLGIGSFQALGRALSDLVNVIPDLIAKGRDYGRIVDDIGDATGATTEHASKFASTLLFLGVPLGGVINMIGQMSRNLEEQGPILNKMGIATTDANGTLLNQLQILDNAREAMSKWGRGTVQADQIAREFGRGGLRTLVDYLQLTDEQFKKITDDAQKSGGILTDAQRDLGESMIREEARFNLALTGLGETIFTVVGPQIRAFFSNLTNWIQDHMTEISNAISSAISFILGLVGSLVGASGSLDSFAASIQAMNAELSPYSTQLIQARLELGKLELQQEKTTDTTDAQRKAIQAQIKAIERQIEVLRRQEAAEDTVFKRTMRNLAQVYQARLDNLELAERERENLLRQQDLNEQLNQAQIDLIEAQRGEQKAGGIEIDADAVSDAMARVADIQNEQAELLRTNIVDGQKEALESTRDYIESIGELLENADNKRAAVSTLKRREEVLAARLAAQQAAGDTEGAADTLARIEAIKTAIVRGEEQIRNEARESNLDRQKAMLQEELSNVRAVAVDTTAIRKAELRKQIADLEEQEAAWEKLTDEEKANIAGVTTAINGEGGLTAALDEARLAGKKFGDDLKLALAGIGDLFGGVIDFLFEIKRGLDDIGRSDVWKFLTQPIKLGGGDRKNQLGPQNASEPTFGDKGARSAWGAFLRDVWDQYIGNPFSGNVFHPPEEFGEGGRVPGRGERVPIFAHGGEEVLSRSLTAKLDRWNPMQAPMSGPAGSGSETIEIEVPVYLDGELLTRVVSRNQERSRGR